MPIYEYVCEKCGDNFEELVFSKDETPACPHCGSHSTHKLISTPARCRGASSAMGEYAAPSSASSGCGGCSGGNCASCGR